MSLAGAVVGGLMGGYLSDKKGRRLVLSVQVISLVIPLRGVVVWQKWARGRGGAGRGATCPTKRGTALSYQCRLYRCEVWSFDRSGGEG